MPRIAIGLECKAYILTGTRASWGTTSGGITTGAAPGGVTEVKNIRNVTINLDSSDADVSSRASGFKLTRSGLLDMSIDTEMPWKPSDATFAAMLAAFMGRALVAMAFLDGDKATSGSQGPWADWEIKTFSREEQLDGSVVAKVKLQPTDSDVPPEWVKVQ